MIIVAAGTTPSFMTRYLVARWAVRILGAPVTNGGLMNWYLLGGNANDDFGNNSGVHNVQWVSP